MAARIEAAPVAEPVRFAFAGDSGAWPDPAADSIFSQLLRQVAQLEPPPAFFANLGDFAGPGTPERHEHYLRLVDPLPLPNVCLVGNHDLDDPGGWETFLAVHGAANFSFAHGHTCFVALHSQATEPGTVDIDPGAPGPRDADLAFLDEALRGAAEPNRVVLMHMPPNMDGHYAPHAEWGFTQREDEFFSLLNEHRVKLVCCAHGLAFDDHVHRGVRVVMSGGGGTAGSSFSHAVEVALGESGDSLLLRPVSLR